MHAQRIWLSALIVICIAGRSASAQTRSELEKSPKGWNDLLADGLAKWKRVPLAPDVALAKKNAWSLKDGVLRCDGVGIKEMFLFNQEMGDAIFHLEWRFDKVAGDPEYNSGVYVRSKDDGKHWRQIQLAHTKKPPFMADLFGDVEKNGKLERVVVLGKGAVERIRPAGEWNTYEITTRGKTITVWVNGAVTAEWKDCGFERGYIGMQAEFFALEFRNLKVKVLR